MGVCQAGRHPLSRLHRRQFHDIHAKEIENELDIVQILRRFCKTAIAAGLLPDMYLLSMALGLQVCHRIQLQFEHNEEGAKGGSMG